jgi:hypothetical protein
VFAEPYQQENWWRVGQEKCLSLETPAPLLIEFDDGLFAAMAALPQFTSSV